MQNEELIQLKTQRSAIDDQIRKVEREARAGVVAEAKRLLATVGLTCTTHAMGVVKKPTVKVAPKYRHKATGQLWTGRGKAPHWYLAGEGIEVLGAAN